MESFVINEENYIIKQKTMEKSDNVSNLVLKLPPFKLTKSENLESNDFLKFSNKKEFKRGKSNSPDYLSLFFILSFLLYLR